MPYVSVWVESDDLDSYSDDELRAELSRRARRKGDDISPTEFWTLVGAAEDLRTAFYARNANRLEAILAAADNAMPSPKLTPNQIATMPERCA